MSTRTTLRPASVLSSGDMSATSVSSHATVLQGLSMITYQVTWTGTSPVGTLALQFSSDYALAANGTVANAGTWTTAPTDVNGALSSSISISGNTGDGIIDVWSTGNYAARIKYTKVSGTGSISAIVSGKVS